MSGRRIGVLGGSFDPVHAAHLELARRAQQQLALQEIWFVPAYRQPLKLGQKISAAHHRLRMLELALEGHEDFVVCLAELKEPGVHYSVDTLRRLRSEHPEAEFFFVMGEDSFRDLSRWRNPEKLLALAAPVVAPRPGAEGTRNAMAFGVKVHWLKGDPIDLSSTALRHQLARGEEPSLLPAAVLEYIRRHDLYLQGEER